MEDIRNTLILGIFIFALGAPMNVSAYSRDTHKGISEAIIHGYEQQYGDKFTSSEEQALIQGSWDEDDDWRFMRHFYDPVNQTGLFGKYEPSKYWAQNTEAQANYECVGAWLCYGDNVGYTDTYFTSPTDFSWDRAIYEYAWGDRTRGAAALGHIIHLLEDATVPAHVRNDAHPSKFGIDIQADPYESYSSEFGQGDVAVPGSMQKVSFQNLSYAFDEVGNYTNKNFVSKDTMFVNYIKPSTKDLRLYNGYLINSSGDKIARAKGWMSLSGNVNITEIYIDDEYDSVAADYWRVLSKKAIETGVGVIDLFFREVEKERQTGVLKAKNTSAAERRAKDNAKKYFGVVKALYGSSLEQGDVDELLSDGSNQVGAAAAALATDDREAQHDPPLAQKPKNEPAPEPSEEIVESVPAAQEQAVPKSLMASSTISTSAPATSSPPSTQQLIPVTPGFGGGGGAAAPQNEEPEPDPEPVDLTVTSPTNGQFLATTSVSFMGTAESGALITVDAGTSTATTTADGAGTWSLEMVLDEGNPTITIGATDSSGERATSTAVSLYLDVTPPALPVIALPQCAASLSSSFCLVATSSIDVQWTEVADAVAYAVSTNGIASATTTLASSTAVIVFDATSTIAVIAYDEAGNAATSTSQSLYAIERPIVINEIAWAGTDALGTDEWIELRNTSSFDIDLAQIVLQIDNATSSLSGVVNPGALYLIEDRAEATSKSHDLVLDLDLVDTGAKISLLDSDGSVFDETPDVSACSGWCAGSAAAVIGTSLQFGDLTAKLSMERVSTDVPGSDLSNWRSNDTYIRADSSKALDSSAGTISGTPALVNSSGLASAGWDCGGGVLTTTGGSYDPSSGSCTYYSGFISTKANRYGDVFRGSVGSSTLVSGHSLAKSIRSDQTDTAITAGAIAGDQFFVAMYEIRNGPAFNTELADFRNYMQTGVGSVPHTNYVTIPWTYAP